jgi:hypothetical protein
VALLCIAAAAFSFFSESAAPFTCSHRAGGGFYSRKQPFQILMLVSGVLAAPARFSCFAKGTC